MDTQEARQKYRTVYTVLGGVFGFILTAAWVCYGLTNHFLDGTSGYAGALAALGGVTTSMVVYCCMIAYNIMNAKYDRGQGCCHFYGIVWWNSWYPVVLIMASVAIIVCSVIFGIRYEHIVDKEDQVNNDENKTMGIINLILGIITNIVSSVALYFGRLLKRDFDQAKDNQGPFADISSKDGHI